MNIKNTLLVPFTIGLSAAFVNFYLSKRRKTLANRKGVQDYLKNSGHLNRPEGTPQEIEQSNRSYKQIEGSGR